MQPHEIPTHLGVEDRAFLGLTMRQLMTAAVSLALAYGAATELPLPGPERLMAAGLGLMAGMLLTLWQPAGRPVDVWAFILLRYWATPRVAVWRPRPIEAADDEQHVIPTPSVRLPHPTWQSAATAGPSDLPQTAAEQRAWR
jgi:hypothetical protein